MEGFGDGGIRSRFVLFLKIINFESIFIFFLFV